MSLTRFSLFSKAPHCRHPVARFAEWRAGHSDEAAVAFAKALVEAKRRGAANEQADRAAALKLDPDVPHIFDRGAAVPLTAKVK